MSRAFTLIEIMIAVGLLSVAAAMTLVMGVDTVARSTAIRERNIVVTFLQTARTEALANVDEQPHGLHIDGTNFTLFSGPSFVSGAPGNRAYARESVVTVSGPTDVIFSQLSGEVTTGTGTLTFTDGAQSATIDINSEGRIDW